MPTHKISNHVLFPGIFGRLSHTGMKVKSRKMGSNYAVPGSSSAISAAKLKVISSFMLLMPRGYIVLTSKT